MLRLPHLVVLSLCACAPEPEGRDPVARGRVDLSWLVPAGCDDAALTDIDILVSGDRVSSSPCGEGGWISRVPAGLQILRLEGLDRFGVSRYAAEAAVWIVEGELTPVPTLVLEALPAEIEVSWFFANARLCSTNDIASIEAAAFDDGTRVAKATADCEQGVAVLRDLPAGQYLLDVVGRDPHGRARFHGERDIDVNKGEAVAIDVELGQL